MRNRSPIGWAIRPIRQYAVFSGRSPRAEYWWYVLAVSVLGLLIGFIDQRLGGPVIGIYGPISFVWTLGLIVPGLAVVVRRLHDIGRTGWWALLRIGGYGFILAGSTSANPAALIRSAPTALVALALLFVLVGAIVMFVFMITEGDGGPNAFGPDPYGSDPLQEVFA